MLLKRIKIKLNNSVSRAKEKFENLGFSISTVAAIIFLLLVILFMGINIQNVYQRGQRNLELIRDEQSKLAELRIEGEALSEDVDFYKSSRFIESYARDTLGLGRAGQELYRFDTEGTPSYELQVKNTDPIVLDDHGHWWSMIFLW